MNGTASTGGVVLSGKIFISYRHDDSGAIALGIAQFLEQRFGRANVFLDIDLQPGQKFADVLEKRLGDCRALLCLIGPRWLDSRDEAGKERLAQPDDWVRQEIERSLARGITVIPVLVNGASLPVRGGLPEAIRPLLDHHAAIVTNANFRSDMDRLAQAIPSNSVLGRRGVLIGAGAGAAAVAVGAGALFFGENLLRSGSPGDEAGDWSKADAIGLIAGWQAYLQRWPSGRWASEARKRIEQRQRDGRLVRTFPGNETAGVTFAVFAPGEREIFTNSGLSNRATSFQYFDIRTGSPGRAYGTNGALRGAPLAPDSKHIVAYGGSRDIVLVNLDTDAQTRFPHGGGDWVLDVAFSPDGTLCALACSDGSVKLRDAANLGQEIGRLDGHRSWVWGVCFSNDGKWLLSGGEDSVPRLWDVGQRRLHVEFEKHQGRVGSFAFAADGKSAYSAGEDGLIRRFEIPSGRPLGQVKAHQSYSGVGVSRSGRSVITWGGDRTIKFWDANAPQWTTSSVRELLKLEGHEGDVWSARQSPDGSMFLSGGKDRFIRLWDISDVPV